MKLLSLFISSLLVLASGHGSHQVTSQGPLHPNQRPNNNLCFVDRIEVKKHTPAPAPATSFLEIQGTTNFIQLSATAQEAAPASDAQSIAKHVGHFTRVADLTTLEGDVVTASLGYPQALKFSPVQTHFFSCVDHRANYAILGTHGGDLGEFILALNAVEKLSKRQLTLEEVNAWLQDYVYMSNARGRSYFYMHTDADTWKKLATDAKVTDPAKPETSFERTELLKLAGKPDYIGCHHLKKLVEGSAGVRGQLASYAVLSFMNVYWDELNPLRNFLMFVVLEGAYSGGATACIFSPDSCGPVAPLVVPNNGVSSADINHASHVKYLRQDLARFMQYKVGDLTMEDIYREIDLVGVDATDKCPNPLDVILSASDGNSPF